MNASLKMSYFPDPQTPINTINILQTLFVQTESKSRSIMSKSRVSILIENEAMRKLKLNFINIKYSD